MKQEVKNTVTKRKDIIHERYRKAEMKITLKTLKQQVTKDVKSEISELKTRDICATFC